jgi:hypothetical protein
MGALLAGYTMLFVFNVGLIFFIDEHRAFACLVATSFALAYVRVLELLAYPIQVIVLPDAISFV